VKIYSCHLLYLVQRPLCHHLRPFTPIQSYCSTQQTRFQSHIPSLTNQPDRVISGPNVCLCSCPSNDLVLTIYEVTMDSYSSIPSNPFVYTSAARLFSVLPSTLFSALLSTLFSTLFSRRSPHCSRTILHTILGTIIYAILALFSTLFSHRSPHCSRTILHTILHLNQSGLNHRCPAL
jgi:hypothetical protein